MSADDDAPAPEETTLRWFGARRPAMLDERTHIATPTGQPCARCSEPIAADDEGLTVPHVDGNTTRLPWHHDCWMTGILGPNWRSLMAEHQRGS